MTKKILVVEDESSLSSALRDKLGMEGFVVFVAKDGESGLDLALSKHPDLILLDITLPKVDGTIMAKKLREDNWGKDVPIIVLTNNTDMGIINKVIETGIFKYFIKSDTKINEIVDQVKKFLS